MDLPNLHLRLDGNDYEGTLAFQTGTRSMLSGTLATEQLALAPFLKRAALMDDGEQRRWSRTPFVIDEGGLFDLDLRISATHLRLAPFTIDDAALAVMTRSDRTEVALVEGRAYGGAMKGRVSIGVSHAGVNLRGAATLADADAATLSWDAFGRQIATGALSGSASIETAGDSPAGLIGHLQGWTKGQARDGELSGTDLGRALRARASQRLDVVMSALRAGRTPYTGVSYAVRFSDGVATIDDGTMQGPEAALTLAGTIDLGTCGLDLHADVAPPKPAAAASGAPDGRPGIRFDLRGTLDQLVVEPHFAPPSGPAPAPGGP